MKVMKLLCVQPVHFLNVVVVDKTKTGHKIRNYIFCMTTVLKSIGAVRNKIA